MLARDNGNSKIDTGPDDIDNNEDEVEIMDTGVSDDENNSAFRPSTDSKRGQGLFRSILSYGSNLKKSIGTTLFRVTMTQLFWILECQK